MFHGAMAETPDEFLSLILGSNVDRSGRKFEEETEN
jgi:hypothetical protein